MKHVSIEIIQKCPNRCLHCSSCADIECNEKIDWKTVKKVLNGLEQLKAEEISISGGEPFLHEDLIDIVKYAKEKGFKVNIYTSGIMLDENRQCISLKPQMLRELHKVGVDKIIFNLQSLKEAVYDEIMGTKGNLKLLKEAIKQTKESQIYTELHFVPMKVNYIEIQEIVDFVIKQKIDRVSFLGLIPHGRAKENKQRLYLDYETHLKVKALLREISIKVGDKVRVGMPLQMEQKTCSCNAGKEKLYIKFDGKVYGCEAFKYIKLPDEGIEIKPDSIHKKDIVEIFNESEYLKAAQEKIAKEISKVKYQETCPIQKSYREKENGKK